MSQAKSPSAVIINELTRIRSTLSRLEQEEASSKQAFQTLYAEMEFYKKDCLVKIENLLLQDLLRFYDSLIWYRQTLHESASTEQPDHLTEIKENFSHIFDEFADLLQDRSVTPVPNKKDFDPALHRIVEVIPTDQENQHNTIKTVVKKGFQRQGNILRFEEVVIYQHRP